MPLSALPTSTAQNCCLHMPPRGSRQHACMQPGSHQQSSTCRLLPHSVYWPAACGPGRLQRLDACAAKPSFQPGASARPGSAATRELAECWPGCSRASWIEGAELSSHLGAGTAVFAAALAEPSAEPDSAAEEPRASLEDGVTRIHEPEQLEKELSSYGSDLVVLMCKAHSCRPCKMFTRKFQRMAEAYPKIHFLEIYGDDTKDTRRLMISMGIRVTPNFRLYRNGELVHQLSGVNETNLRNALEEY